jgi:hypothetical protein
MAIGLVGIGGFAEGLTDGYSKGTALRLAQQRDEREAKAFETDQKMKQAQLDEIERKKSYNDQVARGMAELEARLSGGTVGGVAVDEFGQEIGKLQYSSPAEAKASGLSFKEGTKIEKAPEQLTQTQIDRLRADVFQKARIDNKLYDEDSFLKNRQLNKELKKEGVFEAFELFDQTGDSDKAIEAFNKNGGRTLPKGSFMRKEVDPDTGFTTNVVYAPGADGKPQRLTSSFEMQLLYTPEKLLDYGIAMGKEKFVQGKATERVNIQEGGLDRRAKDKNQTDREISANKNQTDRDIAGNKAMQERYGELYKMYNNQVNGIYKDTFASMNAQQQVQTQTLVLQRAERLMTEQRMLPGAALDEAMRFTLSRQPQPDPKK